MIVVPYLELRKRSLTRFDLLGDALKDFDGAARGRTRREISEIVSKLSDEFKKLYLSDLEGITKNKPQLGVAQDICETLPTYYEGGVRFASNVIDMLITGADKCVIGTATLSRFDELRGAFKLSENITLKVDFRDGIVSFDDEIAGRSLLSLAEAVRGIGIRDILVPYALARQAAEAKDQLGFSLGVFAPSSEHADLERLEVDYIVAGDVGGLKSNE